MLSLDNRPPTLDIVVIDETNPEYWENLLIAEGLSMDRAGSGSRLSYGHRESHTVRVHDYQSIGHNARQKNRGKEHTEKILVLVRGGLSVYAAAKELGLDYRRAKRSVKRYRSNFEQASDFVHK